MASAEVPASKRRCPHCDQKVNRTKGFCPHCGKEYSFEPSLKAGDLIGGKFEIKGPIAFGGMGWIYLGWDQSLSRWVVIKGLLNAKDEAAAAAAVTERRFLAAVKHPKIVGIHDFIQHGSDSFIIMEFVGGRTIESLRRDLDRVDAYPKGSDPKKDAPIIKGALRRDLDPHQYHLELASKGCLPIEEACAYILGILPAFGYLHERGIVYCDFKPENFMLEGDDVKLIDMGGARRIGDSDGDIFGTRGFMAPEASDDPIAVSDLYSLGRGLAALCLDFPHQGAMENSLPSPSGAPMLQQWESLHRFLLRATHPDPDERFQSAQEMADQLLGVLREIAAVSGNPSSFDSAAFGPDNLIYPDDDSAQGGPLARALPSLKIDARDPKAAEAARIGALSRPSARLEAYLSSAGDFLNKKTIKSPELCLRLADALAETGDYAKSHAILNRLENEDPFDWKVQWERGKAYLNERAYPKAIEEFERVFFEMPGELAPKLAKAFALEGAERHAEALALYQRVATVDPRMASAIYGQARCLVAMGDAMGAHQALSGISDAHSLHGQARLRAAKAILDLKNATADALAIAAKSVEEAFGEGAPARQLAGVLLLRVAMLARSGQGAALSLFGQSAEDETQLRLAAETQFRHAARLAIDGAERTHWLDMANRARPRSLF